MTLDENMKCDLVIFRPSLHASLQWLQSAEISTCSVISNPRMLATISMDDRTAILVHLLLARSIIPGNLVDVHELE